VSTGTPVHYTQTITYSGWQPCHKAFSAMTNDVIWLIVLAFFFAKAGGH